MTARTALLACIAALAVIAYLALRRRAVRAYYDGRRDQLAGRVDQRRTRTDRSYLNGALDERLAADRRTTR